MVAPLAGAWIEISECQLKAYEHAVAPLAGAWIEILEADNRKAEYSVAPLAGAWIEMKKAIGAGTVTVGRSPRGSVD